MVSKNKLFLFLRFVISFGLLLVLAWIMRGNIAAISDILKNSNKAFLAIAVSIGLALSVGLAFRLKLLLSGQNIILPIKDVICLTFIGYFFNSFFPTAIGGDVVKAHYVSKKTNNPSASYAAVLVDRLLGAISCLSIALIGVILIGKEFGNPKIVWAVILMLSTLISMVIFLLNEKTKSFSLPAFLKIRFFDKIRVAASKLYTAVNFYRHSTALLIKTYLFSLFMHACTVLGIYFVVLCVGGKIPFFKLLMIVPLIWVISMLPSINGLGVREGAFIYFLKGDIGTEMAFTVSMLWLGFIILYSLIGGIMYMVYPVKVNVKDAMRGAS